MEWRRVTAIGWVYIDEIVFTLFYFLVLPMFDVHLPIQVYIGVMVILVIKDIIVVKLLWNIVVQPPKIGIEALMGKTGTAYTDINPKGIVQMDNEMWNAEAQQKIQKGEPVRVLGVDGLFLEVELVVLDNKD
jgi:membrane-bound ClpP family serine protease